MNNAVIGMCLGISLFFITAVTEPTVEQKAAERIRYYTQYLIDMKVPYVWGGYWIFGADCSGAVAWVLKRAGIGGYPRTTSLKMWLTWPYKKRITKKEDIWAVSLETPSSIFFTYPNKKEPRPFGHTAFKWKKGYNDNEFIMAEASSSDKYFKETLIRKNDGRDKHIVGLGELNLSIGQKNGS